MISEVIDLICFAFIYLFQLWSANEVHGSSAVLLIIIIISEWVRKHETQSCRESCVFSFSNPILYAALHKCVLSTLQQC